MIGVHCSFVFLFCCNSYKVRPLFSCPLFSIPPLWFCPSFSCPTFSVNRLDRSRRRASGPEWWCQTCRRGWQRWTARTSVDQAPVTRTASLASPAYNITDSWSFRTTVMSSMYNKHAFTCLTIISYSVFCFVLVTDAVACHSRGSKAFIRSVCLCVFPRHNSTRRMAIANWTCVSWVAYAPGTIAVNVTWIER